MTRFDIDHLLAGIRQEIDEIDGSLADLLVQRLATSARVREVKGGIGGMTTTPYRPAREAQIMRQLAERTAGKIASIDLVRLWRVILSASINAQASVTIHMDKALGQNIECRLMVGNHFCGMPVAIHPDLGSLISAVEASPVDLAIFDIASPWAERIVTRSASRFSVLAGLPPLGSTERPPDFLVVGKGEAQPSGDDQTILISRDHLPAAGSLPPSWEARSGEWIVSGIPGFLRADDPDLAATAAAQPDLQLDIAGSIPTPIRATT
jgi:chorismate mutase/prephenate dehydratase